MSWTEKLAKLRAGMVPFEVTVTKTYRLVANNEEYARKTIEMHDERTLSGLLKAESIVVKAIPDGEG